MTYRERCERVAKALGLETDGLELLHGNRAGDEAGFRAVPVRSSSVGIWAAVIPHDTMERVEVMLGLLEVAKPDASRLTVCDECGGVGMVLDGPGGLRPCGNVLCPTKRSRSAP